MTSIPPGLNNSGFFARIGNFLLEPYKIAYQKFKSVYYNKAETTTDQKIVDVLSLSSDLSISQKTKDPSSLGLVGRIKAFFTGVLLLPPILNSIMLKVTSLVNQKFFNKENLNSESVNLCNKETLNSELVNLCNNFRCSEEKIIEAVIDFLTQPRKPILGMNLSALFNGDFTRGRFNGMKIDQKVYFKKDNTQEESQEELKNLYKSNPIKYGNLTALIHQGMMAPIQCQLLEPFINLFTSLSLMPVMCDIADSWSIEEGPEFLKIETHFQSVIHRATDEIIEVGHLEYQQTVTLSKHLIDSDWSQNKEGLSQTVKPGDVKVNAIVRYHPHVVFIKKI